MEKPFQVIPAEVTVPGSVVQDFAIATQPYDPFLGPFPGDQKVMCPNPPPMQYSAKMEPDGSMTFTPISNIGPFTINLEET